MKIFYSLALIWLMSGCASSYIAPGMKADLQALAPADIQAGFAVKPSNPFPASIAVVRIQAAGYSNYHLQQTGGNQSSGHYSVILTREANEEQALVPISQLPQVSGITGLNRMLLPESVNTEYSLRQAASRLQADLLLLYTFDTQFIDRDQAKPLTLVTLGLSPTRKLQVTTTSSALLLDTRTGYLYSSYEATRQNQGRSTSWSTHETIDELRRENEAEAFKALTEQMANSWPKLLERHAKHSASPL